MINSDTHKVDVAWSESMKTAGAYVKEETKSKLRTGVISSIICNESKDKERKWQALHCHYRFNVASILVPLFLFSYRLLSYPFNRFSLYNLYSGIMADSLLCGKKRKLI